MDFEQLLVRTAKALNKLGTPYFVTGGYAVSVWGRPRATFDIDVVIQLAHPDIAKLAKELRKIGKDVYADEQMMRSALLLRSEFNVIHPESGIKIDFFISKGDTYAARELARRKVMTIRGVKVYFISAEDLILSKMRWHKLGGGEHHLEDARSVLKRAGDALDMKYIKQQVEAQALTSIWRSAKIEM
ncbi:hypothetical protein A3B21_04030 [Candidatus Uhrbacteria bacterium RIFCSPLOWO2_01_FULL_47_24]|uniref:Uncharacterized protein n=1 Tax=Candidatus Uhrbacteria bacterium RIFCSPLOWO2_01_FULL_47_24 TaxID=1802401 RepID=A0A1F7UT80_9BACT|nr:MAG: hypothetical protein A2753_01175 [Candidatus Uhrbacteria bacterium RIFCSPHIGHO2_01_FULL_47_11]OGL69139.1 MAG: hypothetical protein A3D58_02735 [Candidatus Uhrbacteria bacterium RIFCSPHIGHO2_02_FULL_46_47]OGL74790.1 MAG: hypothetical protein A3F52_04510 [Candidatus Uhrbacteria bacterium RIFCSPHIGHO2_12_FULL_47_11]OGL81510.1 MAG: hypothetical protein A3B21_04030 [Candidatus Uhrbacteria bacterium RIFCSPLOWO2_01_FULL_47_24]OGL83755.1 MAG: hypothetical protein A3J03_01485 [Candidatus Uhrbact